MKCSKVKLTLTLSVVLTSYVNNVETKVRTTFQGGLFKVKVAVAENEKLTGLH